MIRNQNGYLSVLMNVLVLFVYGCDSVVCFMDIWCVLDDDSGCKKALIVSGMQRNLGIQMVLV